MTRKVRDRDRHGRASVARRPRSAAATADADDRRGDRPTASPWRRRSPLWARLCLVVGLLLAVFSAGTLATGRVLIARYTNSVHQASLLGYGSRAADDDASAADVDGPLDVLLAGIDMRKQWAQQGIKPRSDTIMWLHIPASHDRAYLLSLPRDLRVDIPAVPATGYAGGTDRLNASFPYGMSTATDIAGGFQSLAATTSQLTGVTWDMAAVIDWEGFKAVTEQLGGVTMCLDETFTSTQLTGPPLTFTKGCHRYDATRALQLVRQRDNLPDGDYGRQQLQQQYLRQILGEATSKGVLSNPARLDAIIRAVGNSMTVDTGGRDLVDVALAMRNITPNSITALQVPHATATGDDGEYAGEELVQPTGDQLFRALRTDTVDTFLRAHPTLVNKLPAP